MRSKNLILDKHSVIVSGTGDTRAVLDYESGIAYAWAEPEAVLALYTDGLGWLMTQRPNYNQGGWGRGSTGNFTDFKRHCATESLLRAINATIYKLNTNEFLTQDEVDAHNKKVAALKKLATDKALRGSMSVDELPEFLDFEQDYSSGGNNVKGIDPIATKAAYTQAVKTFIDSKGPKTKFESYTVTRDKVTQGSLTVAFRDNNKEVWLNSQLISVTPFERQFMGGESLIQKEIKAIAKYTIPFNVIEAAKLPLKDTKILESGPEMTVKLKDGSDRHFTGALFLENNGRKFLMDLDRVEVDNKLFNVFFVEVDASATSITTAYDSMKPQKVKDAEAAGVEVKRQGEWFFIKTNKTVTVPESNVTPWLRGGLEKQVSRFDVSHGKGRPNSLYRPVGFGPELDALVCGCVNHSGREHGELDLGSKEVNIMVEAPKTEWAREIKTCDKIFTLWELVPNTTIGNFTITGDVD